ASRKPIGAASPEANAVHLEGCRIPGISSSRQQPSSFLRNYPTWKALFRGSVTVWVGGFKSYEMGGIYEDEHRQRIGSARGHDDGRAAESVCSGVSRRNVDGQQSLAGQAHHLAFAGASRGWLVRARASPGRGTRPRRQPALVAPSAEENRFAFKER